MTVVIACADLENVSLGGVSIDTCVCSLRGGGSEVLFLVILLWEFYNKFEFSSRTAHAKRF